MPRDRIPTEISVRVNSPSQLFHSLDPSPFRERDLNGAAEDFIVGWARDADPKAPFQVTVHLPPDQTETDNAKRIPHAIQNFFEYRAEQGKRELRELFREGRRALMIGLPLLAACLLLSRHIKINVDEPTLARLLGESLLILGWVANWRPIEIFLYDWWPIIRRRSLYRRLAEAKVAITAD